MADSNGATENILEAIQVRKEFGGLIAVNDVDFVIPRGSIVSLIGPNGAGKTTFFNILTGVYKPTAGGVIFDGTPVSGLPPHKVTALGMARTFQNIRLFHNMTDAQSCQGRHLALHLPHSGAQERGARGARPGS
jgi:branched-chain amino acid transport system ATP-binding protein